MEAILTTILCVVGAIGWLLTLALALGVIVLTSRIKALRQQVDYMTAVSCGDDPFVEQQHVGPEPTSSKSTRTMWDGLPEAPREHRPFDGPITSGRRDKGMHQIP